MGGCRCSFKNCMNTTKTRDKLHFFHYPVKQKERCRKWIDNAEKPQFYDLDEDQLRNKVICETHFEDCFFPNSQKKRLLQNAVPTLEGDSEPRSTSNPIRDVQVLPASADGTNFVLEINTQPINHGNKIESYIYTNNGLVLPINNADAHDEGALFSESDVEEIGGLKIRNCSNSDMTEQLLNAAQAERMQLERSFESFSEENSMTQPSQMKRDVYASPQESLSPVPAAMQDDVLFKAVNDKYFKKIKQHSKDIAILKRILKRKRMCRRPNNFMIVNILKKQLPPSLVNLVNFNLTEKCDFSAEDFEFFSTVHSTSPELYKILSEKYKWKLPAPELFNNVTKNNGHVVLRQNN